MIKHINSRPPKKRWFALALTFVLSAPCAVHGAAPAAPSASSQQPGGAVDLSADLCDFDAVGSLYIPLDSWIYPAAWRLYSLGFLDTVYLGMRPWTRFSLAHMLQEAGTKI